MTKLLPVNLKLKLTAYGLMAILPLVLLGLLELLCRALPQYDPLPLFIDGPVAGYAQPNPQIVRRYVNTYAAASPKVAPDSQYFIREKQAGVIRIVVAGESTAAGFPFGRFGSPSALLQEQLKRQYPDAKIEVISVAMAAINSYTVRDLMPEILAIKPDAVLLYVGHNEYVGLLGVGSRFALSDSRSLTLAWLWLRRLALYQVLEALLTDAAPAQTSKTAMAQVAKTEGIAYHSAEFQQGLLQFQQNLADIYQLSAAQGVKLVVSSLVSNDVDLPPFLATPDQPDLAKMFATQQFAELQQTLQQGLKQYDCHAQVNYWQARWLALQGYPAAPVFVKARDCDELRFRAPSDFNRFLQQWTQQQQASGLLWLADIQQAFLAQSSAQGIGDDLLLEHVHPNERGYQLLAQAWLASLQAAAVLPVLDVVTAQADTATATQAVSLLSEIDQGVANYKIQQLLADYPFTPTAQPVPLPQASNAVGHFVLRRLQGEDWLVLHQQLMAYYQQQGDSLKAASVAALLSDALPFEHQLAAVAGQLYGQAEQQSMAVGYWRRALALQPDHRGYRMALARCEYLRGRHAEALAQLEQVLIRTPDYVPAQQQAQRIRAQLKLQ